MPFDDGLHVPVAVRSPAAYAQRSTAVGTTRRRGRRQRQAVVAGGHGGERRSLAGAGHAVTVVVEEHDDLSIGGDEHSPFGAMASCRAPVTPAGEADHAVVRIGGPRARRSTRRGRRRSCRAAGCPCRSTRWSPSRRITKAHNAARFMRSSSRVVPDFPPTRGVARELPGARGLAYSGPSPHETPSPIACLALLLVHGGVGLQDPSSVTNPGAGAGGVSGSAGMGGAATPAAAPAARAAATPAAAPAAATPAVAAAAATPAVAAVSVAAAAACPPRRSRRRRASIARTACSR